MEVTKSAYNQKLLKVFNCSFFRFNFALTISAKLKIPFYPVPMTMQTFVVLFFRNIFWLQNWISICKSLSF